MADLSTQPTNKQQALQNLSNQLPAASQKIAQGQAAARNMQLQNAIKNAAPMANTTSTAQQTGQSMAEQQGQQQVQNATNAVQQEGQVGQLGLAAQQQAGQQKVAQSQLGAQQQATTNLQRLSAVNEKAKQEIYDQNMQFQKDEAGRTLFNTTQLMDYTKLNAQSDEQMRNQVQKAQQLSQRNLQAMQVAYQKISQDLQQKYAAAKAQNDFKTTQQITATQEDLKRQMSDAQNRASNQNSMLSSAVGMAGPVAGIAMKAFGSGGGETAGTAGDAGASDLITNSTTEAAGADFTPVAEAGAEGATMAT